MKKLVLLAILFIFCFCSIAIAEPSNGEPQHNNNHQHYPHHPQFHHPRPQAIIPQMHPMFNPPVQRPIDPHMYRQNYCYQNPQYPNQMLIKCGYCGAICYYGQFQRCPRCGNIFTEQIDPQYYQPNYPIPYTMYQRPEQYRNQEMEIIFMLFKLLGNN